MKKITIGLIVCYLGLQLIIISLDYKNDSLIRSYQPTTTYEKTYPIEDYVDNKLNAPNYLQRVIFSGMADSDNVINAKSINEILDYAASYIFNHDLRINQQIINLQYKESTLLDFHELEKSEQTDLHNYEYIGMDENQNTVQGYASLYNYNGNYSIAISFLNEDYSVNMPKALLLADDSNAEKLAYDIIEESQRIYGTDLEPEQASQKFYNSSIEQIAGAISYHAIVTLYLEQTDVSNKALEHAATTNISLIDEDSFFVNRSY